MNFRKLRWYLLFIGVLIITIILRFSIVPKFSKTLSMDFHTFYSAGNLLVHGQNPYSPKLLDDYKRENIRHYYNPGDIPGTTPFWIWVNAFASRLNLSCASSSIIWFYLSMIFIVLGVWTIEQILAILAPHPTQNISKLVVLSAIFFLPIYGTLFVGQTSPLVFLLISMALLGALRNHDHAASICLAFAGAIKIFPAIGLLYLVVMRKWKSLFIGILFFILIQLPVLFQRPKILKEFISSIFTYSGSSNVIKIGNQSLKAFLMRLTNTNSWSIHPIHGNANLLYLLFILSLFSVTLWRALKFKEVGVHEKFECIGTFILVGSICTPFLWHHSYIILLPFFIYLMYFNPKMGALCFIMLQCQHVYGPDSFPLSVAYYVPPLTSLALTSILIIWGLFIFGKTLRFSHPLKSNLSSLLDVRHGG
ncbi:MAG: glycosyltransferase family 87 protein [Candidatus Omnitrophota bacterium]